MMASSRRRRGATPQVEALENIISLSTITQSLTATQTNSNTTTQTGTYNANDSNHANVVAIQQAGIYGTNMNCTFNIGPDNVLTVQGGTNVSVTAVQSNGGPTRVTVTCDGVTRQFDVPNLSGVVVTSGSNVTVTQSNTNTTTQSGCQWR